MRYCYLLTWGLLLWAASACHQAAPNSIPASGTVRPTGARFPIVVQGRWGFIDSAGTVVVAPRFAQVQEFAEGLAPVREAGHYGYLDGNGQLVLPQQYGAASPFCQGLALVAQDSTPRLIDHTGRLIPFATTYKNLVWQPSRTQGGIWIGTLASYKCQLLAATGQLLNPAYFDRIGELSNNRVVVVRSEPSGVRDGPAETEVVGVLNGQGQLVIPYRRFDHISTFREGLATARLYQPPNDDQPAQHCIIDTTGRILARLPASQEFADFDRSEFADGVVPVRISRDGRAVDPDNSYLAAIDRRGQVLFRNPHLQRLTSFYHGRAWAQERDDNWYLLDKTGRRLSTIAVQSLLRPGDFNAAPAFAGGAEVVELAAGAGYAALDSTGRVLRRLAPAFGRNSPQQVGEILTFSAVDSTQHLGFWNWRTGLLVPPRFSAISYAGYQHGLLAVAADNRLGYLSPAGRYVWRAAPAPSAPLNIDFMRRGVYPVASAPLRRYTGAGGWGQSDNAAQLLGKGWISTNSLSVRVAPVATPGAFAQLYHGHRLIITNTTADTIVFDAQNSSLDLTVQAQDTQSRWHDIEYTPSSWCGNSYHQVFLAPGQYWQLTIPAYSGEQATQLRVRLTHRRSAGTRQQPVVVYSNVFVGSVNPAQFWRPQGYSPQSIMDPYLN